MILESLLFGKVESLIKIASEFFKDRLFICIISLEVLTFF